MSDSFGALLAPKRSRLVLAAIAILAVQAPQAAWPQTAAPPAFTSQSAPPEPPPAARDEKPGLLNELGKIWDKPSSLLPNFISPNESPAPVPPASPGATAPPPAAAIPPPPAATPPAPAAPSQTPSLQSGRVTCPIAADGAPDCKTAANALCQAKGYKGGKGITTDSVESCSAKALIPGRERQPGDCRTNYVVTRAFCQ